MILGAALSIVSFGALSYFYKQARDPKLKKLLIGGLFVVAFVGVYMFSQILPNT